jgi:peptidyl-prolyl cis-trans isomerase A (cyclophilin A)
MFKPVFALSALIVSAAFFVVPLSAQTTLPAAPVTVAIAPAPVPATVKVSLQTSAGTIVLALEKERAPITTANFLRYVDQKRLDGTVFYRALTIVKDPLFGLIQGGVRNDPKRVLKPIPVEPTSKTGLTHKEGTISMARGAPNSATGDFFITVGDMSSLDANPKATGDNLGFAAFGRVVEGMEIVRAILTTPVSPTAGAANGMKGQILAAPIKIIAARRIK